MSAFSKLLFPDTLRARYVNVALLLFFILSITAIFGWYTVQYSTQRYTQKIEDRASIESTIHDFTIQYQNVKYTLLEFIIQPDEQNYQLYNDSMIELNRSFTALKNARLQRNKKSFSINPHSIEEEIVHLKTELEKIIRVRLDAQQTFPFTTIMLSIEEKNGAILSAIDTITTFEVSPVNKQSVELKQLFTDTRYTWVRLMAEFRLLIIVRFGVFTGAWQQAFEQRAYNVELYLNKALANIKRMEAIQTRSELPLEIDNELTLLKNEVYEASQNFQDTIILIRSPGWRQDLLILANDLRPAFSSLDKSIQAMHQKEENNWINTMDEMTTIAQQLSSSLWLLLFVGSLLVIAGYFIFDRTILKPIRDVSQALSSQASGRIAKLENQSALAKEISTLMDAFEDMRKQVNSRQQRLENILDNAAEAIITIDGNGLIETFNTAAQELFDYAIEDVLGKNVLMLLPGDKHDNYQRLFLHYQNTNSKNEPETNNEGYEIDVLSKYNKLIPVSIKISKTIIDDKILYTGLVVDISVLRANEMERQQHLAEMAHIGRLSIMGEMAAGIAHELNQPLAAMSLYLQGSLRRCKPELDACSDVAKAVKSAIEQVERAGDIIRKMRSFARRDTLQHTTVDLNKLIEKSTHLVLISQKNVTPKPELILCDQPLLVNVDTLQIEQVLVNLIRNAFEAMSKLEASKPYLYIKSSLDENGFARVFVIDSGEGVTTENKAKIFDTYFTTKTDGLGMGLSICRSIIEEHNGVLWYRPGDDKGSQFCFILPLAKQLQ